MPEPTPFWIPACAGMTGKFDRPLDLAPGSDRAALLEAMTGHVVGKGELVGTFAAPKSWFRRGGARPFAPRTASGR